MREVSNMQPVYTAKANPSDRKTWMDQFIALEPKGGVRDVVEWMQNGKTPHNGGSPADDYKIRFDETVPYAVEVTV
jgi:hypothetical protein